MEQFVTSFGLPGAVILFLLALIGWMVRRFWNALSSGELVTKREAEDIRQDRDRWHESAVISDHQVTRLTEEEQTSTTVLRHIEAYIMRKRGDKA